MLAFLSNIYLWIGLGTFFVLVFFIQMVGLIIISKKTHATIELKSSMKGRPISLFFQDNKYCEWKVTEPDAGLIEDDKYGTFVVDSTYIDKTTKNVLIPFTSSYAVSINVKAAKMCDDLTYMITEQQGRKNFKQNVIAGGISETSGINTLRTSINFSAIKNFVSPILPQNIQSKIVNTVFIRTKGSASGQLQNIILLAISALGAIVLGGLVLKFVVFV